MLWECFLTGRSRRALIQRHSLGYALSKGLTVSSTFSVHLHGKKNLSRDLKIDRNIISSAEKIVKSILVNLEV